MSKKHFIALADCLIKGRPSKDYYESSEEYQGAIVQWRHDVRCVADVCSDANIRFNHQRWMDYINGECGPSGGPIKKAKAA